MNIYILYFIAFNALIFFLPSFINFTGQGYNSFSSFLAMGEKSNTQIKNGEFYRLITSIFLHTNILHLILNMYFLFSLSSTLLNIFNPSIALVAFFAIYFISGFSASVFSFFTNPYPSVGASGAIFGLIGSLLALALFIGDIGLAINLLIAIAVNIFIGIQLKNVDNSSHIGGLVSGFLCMGIIAFFFPNLLNLVKLS